MTMSNLPLKFEYVHRCGIESSRNMKELEKIGRPMQVVLDFVHSAA